MHTIRAAAAAALVLSFACSSQGPTGPDLSTPGPLKAAAAQRPLDEPVGLSTAGYTQDPYLAHPFPADEPGSAFSDIFPATRGVQTQPMAKAIAFDNGKTQLVLARIDAVFVTAVLTERVLAILKEQGHGDLHGKLILDSTHTHAAGCRFSRESLKAAALASEPAAAQHALAHGADTFSQEITDRIAASIAAAVGDALSNLAPARIGTAATEDPDAAHDRRCENDWITGGPDQQTRLTTIRVEKQDGTPIAALFHYAMHGTINGGNNRMLSIDAPGHAELGVEKTFTQPVVAMYLQGSAGDASPNGAGDSGTQAMQHIGVELGTRVAALWAEAGASMKDSLVLNSIEREVPLTHDGLGYADGEFHDDGAILCQALYTPDCPGKPIEGKNVICIGPGIVGQGKYQTRILAARLGDLALVTLPGEPVAAVGRALRNAILAQGFTDALVLGYAQDHDGYILLDQDWLSGGYEPTISFWGWKFAQFIVDQSSDLMHELLTGTAAKKLPEPKHVDPTPLAYTPAPAAESNPAPAVSVQPPTSTPRLAAVRATFFAGDPALGNPEVRLQKDAGGGTYSDVLINGWIPVSSLRGEIPLFYSASPTFKAQPQASQRSHTWTAQYEPPIDLPAGNYRLHLVGRAQVSGSAQSIVLDTAAFTVGAATIGFQSKLAVASGTLTMDLLPLYPTRTPTYAPDPNGDWQLDGFRLTDARYVAPFAPVEPGTAAVAATLTGPNGPQTISLTPQGTTYPSGDHFAPGDGPGLRGTSTVVTGHYTLSIAAGAFVDKNGNANAAFTAEVDAP